MKRRYKFLIVYLIVLFIIGAVAYNSKYTKEEEIKRQNGYIDTEKLLERMNKGENNYE